MTTHRMNFFDLLWDEACEEALQRAHEEGDVDIDRDYTLIEKWEEEYFIDLCKRYGIDPYNSEYVDDSAK